MLKINTFEGRQAMTMMLRAALTSMLALSFVRAAPRKVILVELRAAAVKVRMGSAPVFTVSLKNVSTGPMKVLDFQGRVDLRDAYNRLSVTSDGAPVDVPVGISDPGEIGDSAWKSLKSHQAFEYPCSSVLQLDQLKPGHYTAQLKVFFGADRRFSVSNTVFFDVSP